MSNQEQYEIWSARAAVERAAVRHPHALDAGGEDVLVEVQAGLKEKKMEPSFDFGEALKKLKAGLKVSRAGWNGKGMWLALQQPDANSKMSLPYVYMKTAQGDLVPWLASQTDILANDWIAEAI